MFISNLIITSRKIYWSDNFIGHCFVVVLFLLIITLKIFYSLLALQSSKYDLHYRFQCNM